MVKILGRYKKQCVIIGVLLAIILFIVYLRALFIPGLWHGDAFLYKQADGSFAGNDIYADYKMTVRPTDYGTDIEFSVNDKSNYYRIKYDGSEYERNVEITENNNIIFKGRAFSADNNRILHSDSYEMPDEFKVYTGEYIPTEEELFPGYTKLYNWSVTDSPDTRGNPYMLLLILVFAVVLFVDIKFPNFFWFLEHGLDVDGGEPSDWYLCGQAFGRLVLAAAILVCIVLTFTMR